MAAVEEDALSRLTVRRPTRLLASPTNARLSLLVAVEHCTAVRPSASLQGKSEQYTQAAERLEAALAVRCQNIGCGFKLTKNPASKPAASTTSHRSAPGRPNYPRLAPWVSYAIAIAGSAPTQWNNILQIATEGVAEYQQARQRFGCHCRGELPAIAFGCIQRQCQRDCQLPPATATSQLQERRPQYPPNVERYLSAEEVYGPPPAAAEDDGIPFPRRIELRPPPPSIGAKVDWTAIEAAAAVSSLQQQQKHRPPPAAVATAFGSKLDRLVAALPRGSDGSNGRRLPASYARPLRLVPSSRGRRPQPTGSTERRHRRRRHDRRSLCGRRALAPP